jgi:hypothetical protein
MLKLRIFFSLVRVESFSSVLIILSLLLNIFIHYLFNIQMMRNLLSCIIFLIAAFNLHAQSYHVYFNSLGEPCAAKIFYKDSLYRFRINPQESQESLEFMSGNERIMLKFPEQNNEAVDGSISSPIVQQFEPGFVPEGDMVHDIDFTPDGRLFGVLYKHSSNVYFYDSSYQLLAITPVGDGAVDLEMSNNKAYVCCTKSNKLYIVNLDHFVVRKVFTIPENSCQIEVSPDESRIDIGCFSFMNGAVCAYSLLNYQQLFYNTQPYIHHYGYYGSQGRCFYQFARFELSPDGSKFISAYTGSQRPAIFDAATGTHLKTFDFGSFRGVGFSVTADTMFFLSYHNSGNVYVHRVRADDLTVIDSVGIAMQDFLDYSEIVISSDGQKVMAEESWTEYIYYFDFNTGNTSLMPESMLTNAWIKVNNERKIAAVKVFEGAHLYDLETGAYLNTSVGLLEKTPGMVAAVSPVANKLVSGKDNLFFGIIADEDIVGLDWDLQGNIINTWESLCGQEPEADMTTDAIITTDGTTLVSANLLTRNVSFVNYFTGYPDTLMSIDQVTHIQTIPGSDIIVLSGYDAHAVWFVNSKTHAIEATIYKNQVTHCLVSADGLYAYILTIPQFTQNGTLYKVQLTGSIEIMDQFQVNVSLCSIMIMGDNPLISTELSISPDGKVMLLPDDDVTEGPIIRVIDLELMNEMTRVQVQDVCVYDYAFSEDSRYALICSSGSDLPLIYLDGNASYLKKYIKIDGLTYSVAYNNVNDQFYILENSERITKVNPVSGSTTGSIPTNSETCYQIGIDNNGISLVRQGSNLLYQGQSYDLPGVSNAFQFDRNKNVFIFPTPGPDAISVFNELHVGTADDPKTEPAFKIYPNPAADYIFISCHDSYLFQSVHVVLTDLTGRIVFEKEIADKEDHICVPVTELLPGAYLLRLIDGDKVLGVSKILISRTSNCPEFH